MPQAAFQRASFAGGRPARTRRPRRWRPISCKCFSRRAIPKPRKRRRLATGRAGGLTRSVSRGVRNRVELLFRFPRIRGMVRPRETDIGIGNARSRCSLFRVRGSFRGGGCWYHHANESRRSIEIDMNKLEEVLRRVEAKELDAEDYADDPHGGRVLRHLTELVEDKNTSIARLRKMLFGASTEKTAAVLGSGKDSQSPPPEAAAPTAAAAESDVEATSTARERSAENIAAQRARPQWGRRLHRGREDRGASRVASAGRSLPEVRKGHGLRDGPAGRAGAAGGPGADSGQGLRTPEVALQSVRRGLHGPAARGRRRGEVRRDGRAA